MARPRIGALDEDLEKPRLRADLQRILLEAVAQEPQVTVKTSTEKYAAIVWFAATFENVWLVMAP
mgnify:CR=1 FL=1